MNNGLRVENFYFGENMIDLPLCKCGAIEKNECACIGEVFPKALDDIPNVSKAVQQALNFDLRTGIGFMCQWEENRKNKTENKESCYGVAVATLLQVYGINVDRIGLARQRS